MLSEVQPCLQLLRIGTGPQPTPGTGPGPASPSSDLYTFLPHGQRCTFRLGRQADLTDLRLSSGRADELISRVHAELQAERSATGDWTVHIVDRSTNGTFVNDVRVPKGQRTEVADGDTVTFGHPDAVNIPEGCLASQQDSEFYFLFQKVSVRPADFDAITIPRVREQCGFRPVCSTDECVSPRAARIRSFTESPAASRATLILNSIGSISKLKSQLSSFQSEWGEPSQGGGGGGPKRVLGEFRQFSLDGCRPGIAAAAAPAPKQPASKSRRKTVHTVLPDLELEEEMIQRFSVEVQQGASSRRHCKSESDVDPDLLRQLTLGVRELTPPGPKSTVKRHKLEHSGHILRSPTDNAHVTPTGKKRGRPRKHPVGSVPLGSKVTCQVFSRPLYCAEQCAAEQCQLPQEDTLEWVQCDDCDGWYHTACVGCNYVAMKESSAEFHCGCT